MSYSLPTSQMQLLGVSEQADGSIALESTPSIPQCPQMTIIPSSSSTIPSFTLTPDDISDPIKFIESHSRAGKEYGAIKVIVPTELRKYIGHPSTIDPDAFQFPTNKINTVSSSEETARRIWFLEELLAFSTQKEIVKDENSTTNLFPEQIPKLGADPIDLYRLYFSVVNRGGYQKVLQMNLWTLVAGDMGYKSQECSPWIHLLPSTYEKYLLAYETAHFETSNLHKRMWALSSSHLAGSNKGFKRFTKTKMAKGIPMNAPTHIQSASNPVTSLQAKLALHNITSNNVQDDTLLLHSLNKSSIRNLSDMIKKDFHVQQKIIEQHASKFTHSSGDFQTTSADFETIFWSAVQQKSFDELDIEVAHNLSSFVYCSHLHDLNSTNHQPPGNASISAEAATCPWNPLNIALAPNSLLGTLMDGDTTTHDIVRPTVNVNMALGFENWKVEDHFLQLADYHYYGATKLWHFIPESEFGKWETLKTSLKLKDSNNLKNFKLSGADPLVLQLFESIIGPCSVSADTMRYNHRSPVLKQLIGSYEKETDQYDLQVLVTPAMLQEHGITYFTTLQKPGEFIIKFPKVLSCNISTGTNLSANVNVASKSWLSYASEAETWLTSQNLLPGLLLFKMLTNFANIYDNGNGKVNFDSLFFEVASDFLDENVEAELILREQVRKTLNHAKEVVVDEKVTGMNDWISDIDLSVAFPSKVVVTEIALSLNVALSLSNFLQLSEQIVGKPEFRIELQLYCTDDRLRLLCKSLSSYSVDFHEWLNTYREFFSSNSEANLRNIKVLLAEGDKIKAAMNASTSDDNTKNETAKFFQSLETLRRFVNRANDVVEECQLILNVKHQQRIRGGSSEDQETEDYLPRLYKVLKVIPSLGFLSPETEQMIELKVEIENFDRAARQLIAKPRANVRDFHDLIELGTSFGLVLPSLSLLKRLKDRLSWMETYKTIVNGGDPFATKVEHYTLEHLVDFASAGQKVLGENDCEMLELIQRIITASEQYSSRVSQFLEVEYTDDIDLKKLDEIIGDLELKSREHNDGRIIASAEVYQKLIELRNLSAMLEKFNTMLNGIKNGETYLYQQVKNLKKNTEASGLKLRRTIIADSLKACDDWLSRFNDYLESVKFPSALQPEIPNDVNAKLTLHSGVIKKLRKIIGKVKVSYDFESDDYIKSTTYQVIAEESKEVATAEPQTEQVSGFVDNKPAIYCMCREPEFGEMIECDVCKEWYHLACVHESENEMDEDSKYSCPMCRAVEGMDIDIVNPAHYSKLVEFDNAASKLIPQPPNELSLLKALAEHINVLVARMKEFVQGCGSLAPTMALDRYRFVLRKLHGSPVLIEELYDDIKKRVRELQEQVGPITTQQTTSQSATQADDTAVEQDFPVAVAPVPEMVNTDELTNGYAEHTQETADSQIPASEDVSVNFKSESENGIVQTSQPLIFTSLESMSSTSTLTRSEAEGNKDTNTGYTLTGFEPEQKTEIQINQRETLPESSQLAIPFSDTSSLNSEWSIEQRVVHALAPTLEKSTQ